jgi:uncharacterized protein
MKRKSFLDKINKNFRVHPICALLGPRQVGKTTLAKEYVKEHFKDGADFFDLENPLDVVRLENPMLALANTSKKLIIIDEIQRVPEIFPVLRVLVDRETWNQKILILGSASRDLIRQSSETLAGRIGYVELTPFSFRETRKSSRLWLRGGFPRSYLASNNEDSFLWRQNYISTFLERDIPNLGFNIPAQQLRRFWLMLVHYHGQMFKASDISKSLAVSDHTVRRYLDILAGTFMVRILQPWFENLHKRQIKSFKIYFRDSGILHTLLGIKNKSQLQTYPKLGSFWEGFVLEEIIRMLDVKIEECYFWATHAGAELDLFIIKNGKRIGFEINYVDIPKVTKSMRIAKNELGLDSLVVVYPGDKIFSLGEEIIACGFESIVDLDVL